MYVRTIVADLVPGRAAEAARIFREQVVPVVQEQPGYVSTAMYVNHQAHQAQTVSFWDSKEAMESTSQDTQYMSEVTAMLQSCLVNREYAQWEVAHLDDA